jgi:hypothetical protein
MNEDLCGLFHSPLLEGELARLSVCMSVRVNYGTMCGEYRLGDDTGILLVAFLSRGVSAVFI